MGYESLNMKTIVELKEVKDLILNRAHVWAMNRFMGYKSLDMKAIVIYLIESNFIAVMCVRNDHVDGDWY